MIGQCFLRTHACERRTKINQAGARLRFVTFINDTADICGCAGDRPPLSNGTIAQRRRQAVGLRSVC